MLRVVRGDPLLLEVELVLVEDVRELASMRLFGLVLVEDVLVEDVREPASVRISARNPVAQMSSVRRSGSKNQDPEFHPAPPQLERPWALLLTLAELLALVGPLVRSA